MCDGEDRVVVVKKERLAWMGRGQVIKLGVFRPNALTNEPKTSAKWRGEGLGARISRRREGAGRGLCWVLGVVVVGELRATLYFVLGATFSPSPLCFPTVTNCWDSNGLRSGVVVVVVVVVVVDQGDRSDGNLHEQLL